jgi:hypothetical protein
MAFFDPKVFREKADVYLDMIGYVRDERSRRILHELFEEWDEKAKIYEGTGPRGDFSEVTQRLRPARRREAS